MNDYLYRKQYDYLCMYYFKGCTWTYWASKVEIIEFGKCVGGEDRDKIQSPFRWRRGRFGVDFGR